ncbi:restriction endonuclease [Aquabacterium sp.]|uniref:restriction endonuclease n=1 Tax=Aquabacterium sp. TaxID=1872578 RepID=UPI0037833A1C
MSINYQLLRDKLQWLRGEDGIAPKPDVMPVLGDLLLPLLAAEGLNILVHKRPSDSPIDYAASRFDDPDKRLSVAIEYKHYGQGRKEEASAVQRLLGVLASSPFDRALLISRFGFTDSAHEVAKNAGIAVELLDLEHISAWIDRVEASPAEDAAHVEILIKSLSHEFALMVTRNPQILASLEWRDFERMMARVMEGLGFDTTLTPPSKDGGKDLILTCTVNRKTESYIVELKHWRAGKPVIQGVISSFLKVIVREKRAGGLLLSTSGYAANISESLTEISTQKLRLGGQQKVVLLAQTYRRAYSGLWAPPTDLPEVLFEETSPIPAPNMSDRADG